MSSQPVDLTRSIRIYHPSGGLCNNLTGIRDGYTETPGDQFNLRFGSVMCTRDGCAQVWQHRETEIAEVYTEALNVITSGDLTQPLHFIIEQATQLRWRADLIGLDLPPVPTFDVTRWAGNVIAHNYNQHDFPAPSVRQAVLDSVAVAADWANPRSPHPVGVPHVGNLMGQVDESALVSVLWAPGWFDRSVSVDDFFTTLTRANGSVSHVAASLEFVALFTGVTPTHRTHLVPFVWWEVEVIPQGPVGHALRSLGAQMVMNRVTAHDRLRLRELIVNCHGASHLWDAALTIAN